MSHDHLQDNSNGALDQVTRNFVRFITDVTGITEPDPYSTTPATSRARVTPTGEYRILAETPADLYIENANSFDPPTPNYLICDRTGFKVSRHEGLKEEWTGLKVRKESWEPRHPQDFVRGIEREEGQGSESPESPDRFVADEYGVVTLEDLD